MDKIESKDAVLEALLPEVAFDGWTQAALRAAAARAGIDDAALATLFPHGPRDAVAWFSHWADRRTLAAMAEQKLATMKTRERIALAVRTRLGILLPHREAVRRGLAVLALPPNLPLGARLLYATVDALWYAAGDESTDFNFYTKRGLLAGVYAAVTLFWLDDRSEDVGATYAFLERRLSEALTLPRLAARLRQTVEAVPNPLRFFRTPRRRA
jgi:ubiquinone biosynthesis protein COQ9